MSEGASFPRLRTGSKMILKFSNRSRSRAWMFQEMRIALYGPMGDCLALVCEPLASKCSKPAISFRHGKECRIIPVINHVLEMPLLTKSVLETGIVHGQLSIHIFLPCHVDSNWAWGLCIAAYE